MIFKFKNFLFFPLLLFFSPYNTKNLFSLDVEGHEVEVLKGMEDCDIMPNVIVIEGNGLIDGGSIKECENYRDILETKYGYVYDFKIHCNYFFIKKDYVPIINLRKLNLFDKEYC
jgi:hypothetical protein